jgi:hypothetical protein
MSEEKGNAKNIANFAQTITILNSLGAVYNPSNSLVKLPALSAAHTEALTEQSATDDKNAAETAALNKRASTFEPLSKLVTRISNAVAANITDQLFLDDVAAIVRKLQGRRAEKPEDDPATLDVDESKEKNSVSQMSFDNRIQHFAELIALLKTNEEYAPNETNLKTQALEAYLEELRAANTAATTAETVARNQRNARNEALYNDTDGLLARVTLIKKYLKSIIDTDSPQYKQIEALKFKKPGLTQ